MTPYESCRKISGRWFDVRVFPDERIVFKQIVDKRPEAK